MLSDKVLEALNTQLNNELYSAYLYLSMAAFFDYKGLKGFAHWMKIQAKEELSHAMKIYEYINDRGGRVELKDVKTPPQHWNTVTELFEHAYKHEVNVSSSIHELVRIAEAENDKPTEVFLHWFVEEQVEEEKTFNEILQTLKLAGETPQTLLIMDRELAQRK